jgi:hypothetical protein
MFPGFRVLAVSMWLSDRNGTILVAKRVTLSYNNSSNSALASCRSFVSKPSVNQP